MNIPLSSIEPFGVLGFPKPLELGIREVNGIADPMTMVQSLFIEKQRIMNEVLDKVRTQWPVDNIKEETHGIYEVKDGTWKSQE